ncbi:MAG: M10 family metallopeptidase domain-containing protein [bacterium]|nr:M10 family metallopeptidase domain-containing protein [bacterium]
MIPRTRTGRRLSAAMAAVLLAATSCGDTENATAAPTVTPLGDEPADFAVRGRWPEPGRPQLRYRVDVANAPCSPADCQQAIERAAAAWNATGLADLQAASDRDQQVVAIGWFRGDRGVQRSFGTTSAIAHAGPVARATFLHFDADREWNAESIYTTALHELGHLLGLDHSHSDVAVMGTAAVRPVRLTIHDLAGLHSLYGGDGSLTTAPSDLLIGGPVTQLRRVAPPATTAFAVFDTDGDDDAEVLVWRTDPKGHGTLTAFHFTAGRRLSHTRGPFPGVIAAGAKVGFVTTDRGHRYLVCHCDNGRVLLRQFDEHGFPGNPRRPLAPELADGATASVAGDVDGDGVIEDVARSAGRR